MTSTLQIINEVRFVAIAMKAAIVILFALVEAFAFSVRNWHWQKQVKGVFRALPKLTNGLCPSEIGLYL